MREDLCISTGECVAKNNALPKLQPHQTEAIASIIKTFTTSSRAQYYAPPGSGKTRVAGEIINYYLRKNTIKLCLFFVPTTDLVYQCAEEVKRYLSMPHKLVVFSSRAKNTSPDLHSVSSIDSLEAKLAYQKVPIVLFLTYQSAHNLAELLVRRKWQTDLMIMDESHHTVPRKKDSASWARVHENDFIYAEKRMMMTATPRKGGRHNGVNTILMGQQNSNLYGHVAHHMTNGEAILKEIVVKNKVVVVSADRRFSSIKQISGVHYQHLAIIRYLQKHPNAKAFLFDRTVKAAIKFGQELNEIMRRYFPELAKNVYIAHVNGKTPTEERKRILDEFNAAQSGIITNVKAFVEGFNLPALNAVIFVAQKRSHTEIIQSIARATRKHGEKKWGDVVIPLPVSANSAAEDAAQALSGYGNIILLARLMNSPEYDQSTPLSLILRNKQLQKRIVKEILRPEEYEFILPDGMAPEALLETLKTTIMPERMPNFNRTYNELVAFKAEFGHVDVPQSYVTEKGFKLGSVVNVLRKLQAEKKINQNMIEQLEQLEFSWNTHHEAFNRGLKETRRYLNEHGNANAPIGYKTPEGYDLFKWQTRQRERWTKQALSPDNCNQLEILGFIFSIQLKKFTDKIQESIAYKSIHGGMLVPKTDRNHAPLRRWQQTQIQYLKSQSMEQERIVMLHDAGFLREISILSGILPFPETNTDDRKLLQEHAV